MARRGNWTEVWGSFDKHKGATPVVANENVEMADLFAAE